jgi:hypothetical protein
MKTKFYSPMEHIIIGNHYKNIREKYNTWNWRNGKCRCADFELAWKNRYVELLFFYVATTVLTSVIAPIMATVFTERISPVHA